MSVANIHREVGRVTEIFDYRAGSFSALPLMYPHPHANPELWVAGSLAI